MRKSIALGLTIAAFASGCGDKASPEAKLPKREFQVMQNSRKPLPLYEIKTDAKDKVVGLQREAERPYLPSGVLAVASCVYIGKNSGAPKVDIASLAREILKDREGTFPLYQGYAPITINADNGEQEHPFGLNVKQFEASLPRCKGPFVLHLGGIPSGPEG